MKNHVASWRMPSEKQMKKRTADGTRRAVSETFAAPGPADPMPDCYWDAVLRDPRGQT